MSIQAEQAQSSDSASASTSTLAAPTYVLYSDRAVILGSLIGWPLGAGLLMTLNYLRLGDRSKAVACLALAALATGIEYSVIHTIPAIFRPPLAIAVAFSMGAVAAGLQGQAVASHVSHGGAKASLWSAAGVTLLCSAITLIILRGLGIAFW